MIAGRRLLWPLGLITLLVVGGAAWGYARGHAATARLLMLPPDALPQNAELMRYAVNKGRRGYQAHCEACHGANLTGDSRIGVPNLVDGDWLYGAGRVGQLERVVLYGIRSGIPKNLNLADMPAFAHSEPYRRYRVEPLGPRDIGDLASYLLSFHDSQQDPGSVQRGAALYHNAEKGVCFDCHSADARGDSAIGAPDLTDTVWLYGAASRQSIERTIEVGRAGVCPGGANGVGPAEAREIASYVYSRRGH